MKSVQITWWMILIIKLKALLGLPLSPILAYGKKLNLI